MEFRPCIDIHDGKVKQIVGGSLNGETAQENFVSERDAAFYAELYKKREIRGGHVILLNSAADRYYEDTKKQALAALRTFPKGLQAGGGITPQNAEEYLEAGASHVIVTSYVFRDGKIDFDRLTEMKECAGADRLVLDISCKRKDAGYVIMTNRWQKETTETVTEELLDNLSGYCDEFLVHAVDVEGKSQGIEKELVALLGKWGKKPVTYAGGVHDFEDLRLMQKLGKGRIHVTIGSALSIFGGSMDFEEVVKACRDCEQKS